MNNKIFYSIISILVVLLTLCNSNNNIVENFLPSMMAYKTLEVRPKNGPAYSLPNSLLGPLNDNRFVKTTNMQSALEPRFSNLDYGANIQYHMPDYENQAVPKNPLTFGKMVDENKISKENYCNGSNDTSDHFGGATPVPSGYSAGNYQSELDKVYQGREAQSVVSGILPIGNMQMSGSDGETVEPLVYQRMMYSNQKSRLHSQGDFFRGDLPITPCNTGWFNVSVVPARDLNMGAMNVMGGFDNGTAKQLASLIYESSGNSKTTFGGVNMTNQLSSVTGEQIYGAPVRVTNFP